MTTSDGQAALAVEVFRLLPASLRNPLLEDRGFRLKFGLSTRATLTFDGSVAFARNDVFDAIRRLYLGGDDHALLKAKDGSRWTARHEETSRGRRISIKCASASLYLPDHWYLMPLADQRMAEFHRVLRESNADGPEFKEWEAVLRDTPLENDDVESFQNELKLQPLEIGSLIALGVSRQEASADTLAPPHLRYYERLVGRVDSEATLQEYLQNGAKEHVDRLLKWDAVRGLQYALLLSTHPHFARCLDGIKLDRESLVKVFSWLADRGDRISQVGGFELGVSLLTTYPEIETSLLDIARQIRDDNPNQVDGRLKLLSNLIVVVEGRIAQAGTLRGKRPFWRRMATAAQASLIERALVDGGVDFGATSEWIGRGVGQHYYIQTLVDMRLEPRWLPDFVSPEQLRHELVGRLFGAAQSHEGTIPFGELRELVLGDSDDSLRRHLDFPVSYFPGPLEGATEALRDLPIELAESMRGQLVGAANDVSAFAGLVNSCLVFKIPPELITLAAEAIRKAKYLLRSNEKGTQTFAVLSGLATLAAVTRSSELANEVRILARVARRRSWEIISADNYFRIGMVAAAAFPNFDEWSKFSGEWMTELAFGDLSAEDASTLFSHLHVLLRIEPKLWETCARGEAALSSIS
ncbi:MULTISPECIES: hypothetical protein [unclassified Mesorhizobium]|uniref:hypothetical protein n=1 Tax=unclassified Mesorhizobium TaxID=325217 RepID=UPI000F7538A4|nr:MULTISPECIES: hypothetical protein [unclassified Mesorhizobium]AZO69021.1 hypothetical protein EJ075_31645 [Mesorhizobium sp. M6A.T.Cr.TU.016.01.1.1]RWP56207.1 MAG: hypothetical protein EOR06_03240 [Mesorhizobium sp.]